MRKILVAVLFLTAGVGAFVSCSKDDDKEKVDNSKIQCWEIITKMSMGPVSQSTFELHWGSGTEIDEMIKEMKKNDVTGMLKFSKKVSNKSEDSCFGGGIK